MELRHDPGGKVRLPLAGGIRGGAKFCGPGDCYRTLLWREWGADGARYAFFVGMNPSTADAEANDPTVAREIGFTRRWGLTRYVKANISAYRCTDPKGLREAVIDHPENRRDILDWAMRAERVVLAFGALKGPMRKLAEDTVRMLVSHDIPMWSLGTTKDGSPRHPLYLRSDADLEAWMGWPL